MSTAIVVCIGDAAFVAAAVVDNVGCVPTAVDSNEGAVIAVAGNVVVIVAAGADTAMRTGGIVGRSGSEDGVPVLPAIVLTTVRQSVIAEVASVVIAVADFDGAVAVSVVRVVVPQLDAVVVVLDALLVLSVVAGEIP